MKNEIEKIKKETQSVVVALQHAQEVDGFITPEAVSTIAEVFGKSRSEVYSVATFYHQFTFSPKGKNVIAVCLGTACFVCGAEAILKKVEDEFGCKASGISADKMYSIEHNTRCVGACDMAPVVVVNDTMIGRAKVETICDEIRKVAK